MYIYIQVGIKVGNKVGSASVGSGLYRSGLQRSARNRSSFFAIADCVCVSDWAVVTHLYDHAVLYPLQL